MVICNHVHYSTVSLNTPHGSPGSQLHCVIFVGSLFVHFVACRLGMVAGGPLWCCCPGAFGRGHASMARSGVCDHGLVGICGCPIRAALGGGTAVVVPVLAATMTCPVAWVRFHCCFIVIFFPNMFICVACVKWVHTNIYMFMSTRFSSGIEYPRVGFSPSAAYMRQCTWLSLVQVVACRLFGAKPLPEPMLLICQLDPWEQVSVKLEFEFYPFHTEYAFDNVVYLGGLFVWASMC